MVGTTEINGLTPLEQLYLLLPILVSSATLIQLPAASSFVLNKWRAVQIYDSQEVNEEEKAKYEAANKLTKKFKILCSLAYLVLVLVPEIFIFATADTQLCPTLTFLREHAVQCYLTLLGLPLLLACLISNTAGKVFVNRAGPSNNSSIVTSCKNIKLNFHSFEFCLVTLVTALFVFLTFSLPVETLVAPVLVAILASGGLIRQPIIFRKHSSFRGLFLGPWIYLMFCAIVGTAIAAISISNQQSIKKGAAAEESSAVQDHAKALESDDVLERLFDACRPWFWIVCNFIPAGLITLAYRYDAINAGYGLGGAEPSQGLSSEISDESNTEKIKVEHITGAFTSVVVSTDFDDQGKRAIQLASISIPRLSRSQTPIFNIGMITFLATHIGSILLALMIPSELTVLDWAYSAASVDSPSRIALESVFSVVPPGWPSTVLVPVMMLIRAHFTEQGMSKLWSYNEKWQLDTPKTKKVEDVEKKDIKNQEAQSLLDDFE